MSAAGRAGRAPRAPGGGEGRWAVKWWRKNVRSECCTYWSGCPNVPEPGYKTCEACKRKAREYVRWWKGRAGYAWARHKGGAAPG